MLDHQFLRKLEGGRVQILLRSGRGLLTGQLVSAGRSGAPSLWLCCDDNDLFVPYADVADLRRSSIPNAAA